MPQQFHTEEYDEKLKQIEDIFWMPYVGRDYVQAEKKLFVLGLSYFPWGPYAPPYKMNEQSEVFERNLVKSFINQMESGDESGRWKKFNYAVVDLLLGGNHDSTDVKTAFHKIAKTNYIQNSAHSNVNNNRNETAKSRKVLSEILQVLQPTHVLICAKSIWQCIGNIEYFTTHKPEILCTYHPCSWMAKRRYAANLPEYRATIKHWDLELTK